jgi:hypothetical protein
MITIRNCWCAIILKFIGKLSFAETTNKLEDERIQKQLLAAREEHDKAQEYLEKRRDMANAILEGTGVEKHNVTKRITIFTRFQSQNRTDVQRLSYMMTTV